MTRQRVRGRRDGRGQALVEFSIVLIPFLFVLMGIFDLGRGIYMNNAVSQAAREIARVTSVHPCVNPSSCTLGTSAETAAVVATQKGLVPGLAGPGASITFTCTTITDATVTSSCYGGPPGTSQHYFVSVHVSVPFTVITPLLGMVAPASLSSTSHVEIP